MASSTATARRCTTMKNPPTSATGRSARVSMWRPRDDEGVSPEHRPAVQEGDRVVVLPDQMRPVRRRRWRRRRRSRRRPRRPSLPDRGRDPCHDAAMTDSSPSTSPAGCPRPSCRTSPPSCATVWPRRWPARPAIGVRQWPRSWPTTRGSSPAGPSSGTSAGTGSRRTPTTGSATTGGSTPCGPTAGGDPGTSGGSTNPTGDFSASLDGLGRVAGEIGEARRGGPVLGVPPPARPRLGSPPGVAHRHPRR